MARKTNFAGNPQSPEHIQCAHETCTVSATVRTLTATGWAKFCEGHLHMYRAQLADANYVALGLNRQPGEEYEQHRKRVFAWLKEHARVRTFRDAEAAEDAWSQDEMTA